MNSNPVAVMAAVRGAWTFNLACCGVADISLILLVIALETSSSLMHRTHTPVNYILNYILKSMSCLLLSFSSSQIAFKLFYYEMLKLVSAVRRISHKNSARGC